MNPIDRMRKERRWGLVFFNLLLLLAALLQVLSLYMNRPQIEVPVSEPVGIRESGM